MKKKRLREPVLYGTKDAALMLGLDAKTLRKEIEAKNIPGVRMGRNYKIPAWWIRQLRDGPTPPAQKAKR